MVIINWWHNLILFCALTLRVHSLCTSGKWNFRFANGGAFVCDATCSDTCIRHETTTNPYHLLVGASCAIIPKMLHATERCLPPKMTRISMTAAHIERCSKMVNKYAMRAIAPPHSHIHHSRIFWISLSIFDVFFSSSEWCTPKGPPLLCRSVVGSAYFVWSADFECLNAGEFVAELFCCSFFFLSQSFGFVWIAYRHWEWQWCAHSASNKQIGPTAANHKHGQRNELCGPRGTQRYNIHTTKRTYSTWSCSMPLLLLLLALHGLVIMLQQKQIYREREREWYSHGKTHVYVTLHEFHSH